MFTPSPKEPPVTYTLYDADTGNEIRPATLTEALASVEQADRDGGAGIIEIDGHRCYVIGDPDLIRGAHHLATTDSDLTAYDATVEDTINLRDCTSTELWAWLEAAQAAGDTVVENDVRALLATRGLPGAYT